MMYHFTKVIINDYLSIYLSIIIIIISQRCENPLKIFAGCVIINRFDSKRLKDLRFFIS